LKADQQRNDPAGGSFHCVFISGRGSGLNPTRENRGEASNIYDFPLALPAARPADQNQNGSELKNV
jgi:hypothetical protein